ncbi:MAG: hypothetical protein ACRC7N_13510 [Clostridium sp.]
MTVKELIEELQKYDEGAEVVIYRGKGDVTPIKKDSLEYDEFINEVVI